MKKRIDKKFYPGVKELIDNDEKLSKFRDELVDFADFLKEKISEMDKLKKVSKNKKKAMRRKMKKTKK